MRGILFMLGLLGTPMVMAAPLTQPSVPQMIKQLGDLRPDKREAASKQLSALGMSARSALIRATRSDDPEIASRASDILRHISWAVPTDPHVVRDILQRHSQLPMKQRGNTIMQLISQPNGIGIDALFRLLQNEADDSFRWQIVNASRIRTADDKTNLAAKFKTAAQALDTTAEDPPVLVAAGDAWWPTDPAKAVALYVRALQATDPTSSDDDGTLRLAQSRAINWLWDREKFNEVASLYRREGRSGSGLTLAGAPEPAARLFALHARFGPLRGFVEDCRQYQAVLLRPPMLYAAAAWVSHRGFPVIGSLLNEIAFDESGTDSAQRQAIGQFLHRNGWEGPAIREIKTFLAAPNPGQPLGQDTDIQVQVVNAHLLLADAAARAGDHLDAAKEIEVGIALIDKLPAAIVRSRGGQEVYGDDARVAMQTEMQGHYLLDAIERNDQPEIKHRIDTLRSLSPDDSEVIQEMVVYLDQAGDTETADKFFAPVEKRIMSRLATDSSANNKNSLAWFYARSGRKLDEALKLATEAVAVEPDKSAYIDTLAEVYFQKGDATQAVKLEKGALRKDPTEPALQKQLVRFKRGKP